VKAITLARSILQNAIVVAESSGKNLTTQAEELTARSAIKRRTYLFFESRSIQMKINVIAKLSIIFYATTLLGEDKEQLIKKIVSYTENKKNPSTEYIINTIEDKRLQADKAVLYRFKNKPEKIKTYEQYKKIFFNEQRIFGGVSFYKENKALIARVAKEFEIDPIVIIAIVGVETNYGSKTTGFSVINSLYTQATKMPKRASWATKELAELLIFCSENNIDPFSLEGSYAGAFGYGQFIPSSFNNLSIDYSGDGTKDPYNWEDVLGSIAFYLTENGYPKNNFNFSYKSKAWKSIRTYNRSDKYANVVLDLRNEIAKNIFLLD
jgi:membrane-bound lytic murein transglycosylase B